MNMSVKGTLIPIGGNENKGVKTKESFTLEYIRKSILSRVVAESGGIDAFILVIPTASSIPEEVGALYLRAFEKLGCTHVKIMDIREREQCEDKKNIELIKNADCVMFSGGDQSLITRNISGTTIHKILLKRYKNEDFVIAGTSAGAMCMSQEMITGSNQKKIFTKGAVGMDKGLGFIPNFIIDSHFIKRRRFGRLAGAVAKFPNLIGIGLDEDTALVIKKCNVCEIIGSGMIILFDPRKLRYNNEKEVEPGGYMSVTNLKTHILTKGDCFNIKKNKIKIAPENQILPQPQLS